MYDYILAIGLLLIFLGFIAIIFYSLANLKSQNASVGGVILLGPIPITFGNSSQAIIIAQILSIVIIILIIILYLLRIL